MSLVNKDDGRELAATGTHALGQFMHEPVSEETWISSMIAYCQRYYEWFGFPYYDFNKPKLDPKLTYAAITPTNWTLRMERDATGDRTASPRQTPKV